MKYEIKAEIERELDEIWRIACEDCKINNRVKVKDKIGNIRRLLNGSMERYDNLRKEQEFIYNGRHY
jgi:hypothetical protein